MILQVRLRFHQAHELPRVQRVPALGPPAIVHQPRSCCESRKEAGLRELLPPLQLNKMRAAHKERGILITQIIKFSTPSSRRHHCRCCFNCRHRYSPVLRTHGMAVVSSKSGIKRMPVLFFTLYHEKYLVVLQKRNDVSPT